MFSEIPDAQLVATYVSESFAEENKYAFKGENFELVSDSVFKKISDTVSPQGIMAIVEQYAYTLDDIIENVDVSEKIKNYDVKFHYINSQGEVKEGVNKVTIIEEQGKWVISTIR